MSKRYPGGFLTGDEPTVNAREADGIWTLDQQAAYQGQGVWPPSQYQISRSLRFNSADSAYLSRTPASAGTRTTWTYSVWLKIKPGIQQDLLESGTVSTTAASMLLLADGTVRFQDFQSNVQQFRLITTQVFRDPSSWYHFVFVLDTTNATSGDRVRMYVNGQRITSFSTEAYPTQNLSGIINNNVIHTIGRRSYTATYDFDGYLADIHLIDGQALTPSDFGRDNPTTGVWEPLPYIGTYGTNGFHLTFADNSGTTATTLGADSSGNGNNWTPSGISVSPGAGNDSLVDTPTPYGIDTGAGGEVRGNYCTWNPLKATTAPVNGNLAFVGVSGSYVDVAYGTIGVTGSGKYYFETVGGFIVGLNYKDVNPTTDQSTGRLVYRLGNGVFSNETTDIQTGLATSLVTDTIGVALNLDAGTLAFYKNNTQLGTNISIDASLTWWPFVETVNTWTCNANFGQRPFAYTAPSGFKALCTQNLPDPTIADGSGYFNTVLYTGNGTGLSVTGVGFQPDFTWLKARSAAFTHGLIDAVRGSDNYLASNSTAAEASGTTLTFLPDGFSLTTGFTNSGVTYVSWNWNAGGSNATNTDGTITSTVRANPTAGFSIVSWTATGSVATTGHGLGAKPKIVITKQRSTTGDWAVLTDMLTGTMQYLYLNTTQAINNTGWGTSPTDTVMSVYSYPAGQTIISYCFAEVEGYSKFGSYTGNGSADGPFVYCGFRPAWLLVKRSSVAGNFWILTDNGRQTYNVMGPELYPNATDVETAGTKFDYLSNGFKLRTNAAAANNSTDTYIFAAFAENPFKYSLAR